MDVHDITQLYSSFDLLIEKGYSVLVIEHNPEIIKYTVWVIDLDPESGKKVVMFYLKELPNKLYYPKHH